MDSYADYVKILVMGYDESSIPLLQTCEPANPHGIEWDRYTYVDRTPIDILLEKLLLKNIISEQIQEVRRIQEPKVIPLSGMKDHAGLLPVCFI